MNQACEAKMKIWQLIPFTILSYLALACNPFDHKCPVYGTPPPDSSCAKSLHKQASSERREISSLQNKDGIIEASPTRMSGQDCGVESLSFSVERKIITGTLCNVDVNLTLTESENSDLVQKLQSFDESQTDLFSVIQDFVKSKNIKG